MYCLWVWRPFSAVRTLIWLGILSNTLATAVTDIPKFNTTPIESHAHHEYTIDTSRVVWPWRSFKTSRHTPPQLNVTYHADVRKLANGYIFLSPSDSKGNDGTYDMSGTGFVMDSNGDLIYAGDEDGMGFCDQWVAGMTDFRVQEYQGRKYLTYWNGCNTRGAHWGHRWGRVTFIDVEYNRFTLNPDLNINTLEPATRGSIDVHEHQMTDRNTMLVTSYNNTQYNLTSIDGPPDAWVADSMFFEIDVATQKVVFQWAALDHLDLNASHYGINAAGAGVTERIPWDHVHINSVERVGDDYLISARHHFAIYLVSGKDGSILWKLDGLDGGDFGSIPVQFRWQHHARAHNITKDGMTVSLFNNMVNKKQNNETQTNALAFWLPLPPGSAPPILVRKLQSEDEMLFTGTQGSYQMDLGNGNGFVGYGKVPILREYDLSGSLLWQAQFGDKTAVMNYRGFKMEWHGTPKSWDPVVVIENPRFHIPRVYVSWNGATEISGWAVWAGETREVLEPLGVAGKKAFETVFEIGGKMQCVRVGAVRQSKVIRMSNIACLDDAVDSKLGYNRLLAENARLKGQLGVEGAVWGPYRTFAEVAMGVVGVVFAVWMVVIWRDWRRKGKYETVKSEEW